MTLNLTRQQRRAIQAENRKRPKVLTPVPESEWPNRPPGLEQVWMSREFLVQVYLDCGFLRLSVNTTSINADDWVDGIPWDTLQKIKRDVGYGNRWAVECYPAETDVVQIANIRHLWILPEVPSFGWARGSRIRGESSATTQQRSQQ